MLRTELFTTYQDQLINKGVEAPLTTELAQALADGGGQTDREDLKREALKQISRDAPSVMQPANG